MTTAVFIMFMVNSVIEMTEDMTLHESSTRGSEHTLLNIANKNSGRFINLTTPLSMLLTRYVYSEQLIHPDRTCLCEQLSVPHRLTSACLLLITWAVAARSTSMVMTKKTNGNIAVTVLTEESLSLMSEQSVTPLWLRTH